ncbi:MAG: hypothetical protein ACRD0A_07630, partial [Acidimicrobiales bacterium]
ALGRTGRAMLDVAGRRVRRRPASAEWLSHRLLEQLETVLDRGVPVLFVYGDDDPYLRDFETARTGALGPLVDGPGGQVRVVVVPGRVHGLTSSVTQDAVLAAIEDWATTELLQPAEVEPTR